MLGDLFVYSVRNLTKRKLRTWLTMLGIVIGIASVIALVGLGNGLRAAVTGQFNIASVDVLTIQASGGGGGPPGQGVVNPLQESYVDEISALGYVDIAIGRLIKSVTFEFNDIQTVEFVGSIPDATEARRKLESLIDLRVAYGRLLRDGERDKVVLGANFYTDEIEYKKPLRVGNTVLINGRDYEVVGFLKKRGSFIFDNSILMLEDELRLITKSGTEMSLIVARAKTKDVVDSAKVNVENYLRKKRDVKKGEEDFVVQTPKAALQTLDGILAAIQGFIVVIAAISMIVGAIGIVNTMFTAVLERRKEIGIMKAIGAQNKDIFMLFFIESGLLGLVGGAIGALIGTGAAVSGTLALTSFIGSTLSTDINFPLILFTLIGSFILGAISGIVPAMQAASLPPVKALRS